VKGLSRWDQRSSLKTWMYTIARNHCVDATRKRRHRKTESLDQASDPEGAPPIERVPGPGDARPDLRREQAALRRAISEGVAQLPEAQREVFVLREYAGARFGEIAEMTGVSENTVKSRMRYALEHLRRHLEAAGFAPGNDP
jgi:RNA polymerase sigma-70 factor (ECF subfamily)